MNENVKAIKAELKQWATEGGELQDTIDEWSEWDSKAEVFQNFSRIAEFMKKTVQTVENITGRLKDSLVDLSSADKLDAAAEFIDEKITFPFLLELFDGIAIRMALSAIVSMLNEKFGHNWPGEDDTI